MAKREMKKEILTRGKDECECHCGHHHWHHGCKSGGGCIYGLGFIGAAIYYISTATGFWVGVLGILKAIVWPAILIYGLLKQVGI